MNENNPEFLKHFDLLKSIGVIATLDENNRRIQTLESILVHAWNIFTKDSIESIIEYVKGCLDEMFIPEDLVFIVQSQNRPEYIQCFAYRNLKRVSCELHMQDLAVFEDFFIRYPTTINYSLFEYKLENQNAIDQLPGDSYELIVPIVGFSGLYGIILFGKKILGSEYSELELTYIDKLMKLTSIAIQNTLHYQGSVRDLKTGLYNHSFFQHRLSEEFSRASRYRKQFGILLLDIDHFKNFNDTYGHLAGDEILVSMSHQLTDKLRKADIIARFGGEEFIILVPETNKLDLFLTAERIRISIEDMHIQYGGKNLHVTVSVGGTCYNDYNNTTPEILLGQADRALYISKNKGRNCTTIFNPGFLFRGILYKYRNEDRKIFDKYLKM
ncbi:MAG: GGDEF domain-containing protein [Spirochaetales bacterium]|nr:GGDEF domain-containing protein [Spirochaetales bacterium]